MAVLGLIAAVVVPVSLSGSTDKSLTRPIGPTPPGGETSTESVAMPEKSDPAPPTTGEATGAQGEYRPTPSETAAVVEKVRRYLEAINAGDVALADSLTCGDASLLVMTAEGTLTLSGEVEWSYSGEAASVPYLVDGQLADTPLVIRRHEEKGFCPTA